MKKKGITLALLLSCTTAAAAPALPSTNSDLRALEQNKAQTPQQAADKVTAYLRKQGYTVATAFIPPQQIANGAVEIRVLLGNLGQVTVNNKSGLKDAVISSFIDRLHGGAAIKTNELETVLNNLNDLPGIRAAGMLKAGASVGSRLGISYSQMDYTLGDYFNLLDAVGKAKTFSIYGSTPLTNTSSSKLDMVYGYDNRQLQDEMRLFGYNAKKSSNAVHTGISGNSRGSGSYTGYSALYYWGQLTNEDFNSETEGSFHKLTGDVNHSRRLGNTVDLLLNFHSQLANKQLDGSEQFSLGGANGVRAYPQGEASGDSCYQTTAELRCNMPLPYLSLATFVDFGEVEQRGYDDRHRNLAGWGIGVQYAKAGDYYLRLDYARKLNSEAFQSEDKDKNGRLWFQAYKLF